MPSPMGRLAISFISCLSKISLNNIISPAIRKNIFVLQVVIISFLRSFGLCVAKITSTSLSHVMK